MTSRLQAALPIIKWVSTLALTVLVVIWGWFISPYLSFEWFLKENLGQVSGYALLVVLIHYVAFTLIEYFVERNARMRRWLEEVYRITREVQEEETEEALLKRAMSSILEVFEFDRAAIFLTDDALPPGRLGLRSCVGFPMEEVAASVIDLKRDSPIPQAVEAGLPKVFDNVGEAAFDRELLLAGDQAMRPERFALIPLRQEGKTAGALYIDRVRHARRRQRIEPEEMRLLGTYLDQVSVVLQRVRLLNREKALSKTLGLKVSEALGRERELEEKLRLSETLAALGEMAASLTHEIKNPLGGLDMYARILQRDLQAAPPSNGDAIEIIGKILDGIKTLDTIVGNLLGYARVARGEMNDRIVMADVLEAAGDFVKPEIQRIGVKFKCVMPRDLVVTGNFDQLRQVFLNLLLNGAQSMQETGGTLTVRGLYKESATEEHRPWVVTEITDTGVGMTEEQKGRVFEDFYTTREKGTGLGLAISRKIVKVHGGEITFESEWKKGSTFRVYLPRAVEAETETPAGMRSKR
ncbi:MAG: hypothetical protein A3G34_17010 [Candidatus Lindowbacteria bacterium RIFCSPLOWO2_12_FULL_62_27]|nr:MAG: hypothetical protein A3G34_17010 [Candidatus Lindowbacteria bacterium RIFCSPLOWO2_12_FULL_62_27]OGH63959.1 MAG: hypothetical protein A3I06_10365 [Candidatus Lindowbacteria bacterium RIFCSPLOWO2_02_FULL_62_12]